MSLTDKYRPKRLEDVLGQDHVIKSLKEVIKANRAKAFIFGGPSGTGKTTLARILASKFAGGKASVTNVSERDGAFASGAEAVRNLVSSILYRAIGESPVKAIILDECHKLSNTAWNVLLKPIEEPPAHVYWMLCTTEPGKIPQTIKTRCLTYTLQPVKEELLLDLVSLVADEEGFETPDSVLEVVAEGAQGSPRLALNLLEACAQCKTAVEARQQTRQVGQTEGAVALCRFVLQGRGGWAEACRLVKALEGYDPESARVVIMNYLAAVALSAESDERALNVLMKMEHFSEPYNQSDKLGPLLLSIGAAIRVGE